MYKFYIYICICIYMYIYMYIGRYCNNHWLCDSNSSGTHKQIKV